MVLVLVDDSSSGCGGEVAGCGVSLFAAFLTLYSAVEFWVGDLSSARELRVPVAILVLIVTMLTYVAIRLINRDSDWGVPILHMVLFVAAVSAALLCIHFLPELITAEGGLGAKINSVFAIVCMPFVEFGVCVPPAAIFSAVTLFFQETVARGR